MTPECLILLIPSGLLGRSGIVVLNRLGDRYMVSWPLTTLRWRVNFAKTVKNFFGHLPKTCYFNRMLSGNLCPSSGNKIGLRLNKGIKVSQDRAVVIIITSVLS